MTNEISLNMHNKIVESYKNENIKLKNENESFKEMSLKFKQVSDNLDKAEETIKTNDSVISKLDRANEKLREQLSVMKGEVRDIDESKHYYDHLDNSQEYIQKLEQELTKADNTNADILSSIIPNYGTLRSSSINSDSTKHRSNGMIQHMPGLVTRTDTWDVHIPNLAIKPNEVFGIIPMDKVIQNQKETADTKLFEKTMDGEPERNYEPIAGDDIGQLLPNDPYINDNPKEAKKPVTNLQWLDNAIKRLTRNDK